MILSSAKDHPAADIGPDPPDLNAAIYGSPPGRSFHLRPAS